MNSYRDFEAPATAPAGALDRCSVDHRRDLRLDLCRGLALWFIFIDHVPGNLFAWLTIRNYGFSDTSEVFFFVSGYTCMLAYGGALPEQGWLTVTIRAVRRAVEIYCAFLLLIVAYVAVTWLTGGGIRFLDETNLGVFLHEPGQALTRALALQYAPVNTDALPTFVLLHLAFPLVLWMVRRNAGAALALSFMLWLMVQTGDWHLQAWPSGELFFNPFAFQFLFVLGAWYAAGGWAQLKPVADSPAAFLVACAYLIVALFISLSWQFEALQALVPETIAKWIYPIYKGHLDPVRLLHFLALALVLSRMRAPRWSRKLRPLTTAMIRCGENSLSMYCLGVLLSFIGLVILTDLSDSLVIQTAVTLGGVGVMILAATLATWEARLDRRGPKLF